jgi:hypothetical protein
LIAVLVLPLGTCTAAHADASRVVEYLYLEANEGGSSGGHVALGLGDRTYHFQRDGSGLLRLERDDAQDFRFRYAVLQNRTIHRTRVAVSEETYTLLLDAFNTRYLMEQQQLALLDALRGDRDLLALIARRRAGLARTEAILVAGAGFFLTDPNGDAAEPARAAATTAATAEAPRSGALVALRARVAAAYGADFLDRRSAALRAEIQRLEPLPHDLPPSGISPYAYPASGDSFSARYRERLTGLAALETLRDAPPLRPDAVIASQDEDFVLTHAEEDTFEVFRRRLEDQLVRLVASGRPDWGFPLLVGMARLVALTRSTASGRLVLLDAFPAASARVPSRVLCARPEAAHALGEEAREDLAAARRAMDGTAFGEAEYTRLEAAGNRLAELRRGVAEKVDVRLQTGAFIPSRSAPRSQLVLPDLSADRLATGLALAEEAERSFEGAVEHVYRYDLIRRNCVSELFRTIDAAVASPSGASDTSAESTRRLGGHIAPGGALGFIPFVSDIAVRHAYTIEATDETPAYRRVRIRELAAHEGPLAVTLRESNTVSSTIYRRSPDDSLFLFFTDGAVAPRPLLGAANLAVGVGASLVGLALLAADHGETLSAGLRGVLYSVPELAFINIRKGSFDQVDRRQ